MISIFTGRPGTGKTYSLVRFAYLKILKEQADIYSNFHIDFSDLEKRDKVKPDTYNSHLHFWTKLVDFVKIKQGIILIDEAQIYFNSRKWQKFPEEVQYKFQQHRKGGRKFNDHGLDIVGAVQNVKRIDTVVRELVNTVLDVRKIGK